LILSNSRRRALRAALELKLRRAKGTRLQEFLSALMTKIHGLNFQPAGTDYSRGDLQCDGMLYEPLTLFACYGPVNAGANATNAAMRTAIAKVESDFTGALEHWPDLTAWNFVHNYVEQPPAQIVQKILELRKSYPAVRLDLFGRESFEAALFSLDDDAIEDLVGDAATDEDFRTLQPAEVLSVVDALMASRPKPALLDDAPIQVPTQKLHFNNLTAPWQDRIVQGMQNAETVGTLLQGHQNPLLESAVAGLLKAKYLDLKAQSLDPDEIMFRLHDFIVSVKPPSAALDVVAWSLLAHFFEKCTIFEDKPVGALA